MTPSLDDMYREIILDHYRSPRGKKPVDEADIHSEGQNPSCGDEIKVDVDMEDGVLKNVHVNCRGCAISVASGSMLAETVKGKSFAEVEKIAETVRSMLRGEIEEVPDELGDIDALKGVKQFPVRIKCALLAWATLVDGLKKYAEGKGKEESVVSTEEDKES
jgi:nitrogen fixation NifU-like protein